MIEEFIKWEESIREQVEYIEKMLMIELENEPEALIDDIIKAEAWYARCGVMLAQADSFLDRATLFYMPDREGKMEADRKAIVDSKTSPLRCLRDTLESLTEAIKQRLSIGQSILSYHRQFLEKKL